MISPLEDGVDRVRGPAGASVIVEYGDYECPYSRQAYRSIERSEPELSGDLRFAFRHFPLTEIHPQALEDEDLQRYASELGLSVEQFDSDRNSQPVLERIERDFRGGLESREVGWVRPVRRRPWSARARARADGAVRRCLTGRSPRRPSRSIVTASQA